MIIREITEADLDRVMAFSRQVYGPNNIAFEPAYFDWQFMRCAGETHEDGCGALLALDNNNEVVATCLVGKYPVLINGQIVKGGWIQDWFAASSTGGVGLAMFSKATNDLGFFGGAGVGQPAIAAMSLLMPGLTWFELERMFAVIDPQQTAELCFATNTNTIDYLGSLRVPASDPAVASEKLTLFDAAYDDVWSDIGVKYLATTHRSSRFMNWRYIDHPLYEYQCYISRGSKGPVYYVWRDEKVANQEVSVGRICDVIGEPQAIAETFPSIFSVMARAGHAFVDFHCSNAAVNAALAAAGMQPVVSRPDFDLARLFQPLESAPNRKLDYYYNLRANVDRLFSANYSLTYFTKSDSNQDRPNKY